MAQIDTGLGWSAKDTFLSSAAGFEVASLPGVLGGPDFPGQPLPVATTRSDILAAGFMVRSRDYRGVLTTYYIAADTPGVVIAYIGEQSASFTKFTYISPVQGAHVYIANDVNTTVDSGYMGTRVSGYDFFTTTYPASISQTGQTQNPTVPVFTDLAACYAAIVQLPPVSIYKENYGYAVAAFVKWNTQNGRHYSPVLISSVRENVMLDYSGTYSEQESTHFYGGLTFYMRLIPSLPSYATSVLPVIDITDSAPVTSDMLFTIIRLSPNANILVTEELDPYDQFGNSGEGGGIPNPNPEDEGLEEPPLPSLSFHATGLCRIYRADETSLRQLAQYMWTDNTFLQTLINHAIQLIENPMDAIISLSVLPVAPPDLAVGAAESISVMYIPIPTAMWPVLNQFVRIDCGTLTLEETYGSALDYNPYTKVSCFLPYIGFVDLDTDEVMGKTLQVVYRIDVVSGVCVAMILVNGVVMYQFSGHCAIQMPLSSADFSGYIGAILEAGKLVAGTVATAAGAPGIGGMLLNAPPEPSGGSTTTHKTIKTRNQDTNRMRTAAQVDSTTERTPPKLSLGELVKRQTANTVGAVVNSKFGITHSGGFSGNSGYMGVRRPFIIVKYPNIANPEQYGQLNGRPSMIYMKLGDCTGYTEVQSVQLTGIPATNSELSELGTLLKSGVIL